MKLYYSLCANKNANKCQVGTTVQSDRISVKFLEIIHQCHHENTSTAIQKYKLHAGISLVTVDEQTHASYRLHILKVHF